MKKLLIGICALVTLPIFACDETQKFCVGDKIIASRDLNTKKYIPARREQKRWPDLFKGDLFKDQKFLFGKINSNPKNGKVIVKLDNGKKSKSKKNENYLKDLGEVFRTSGCTNSKELCVGDGIVTQDGVEGIVAGVKTNKGRYNHGSLHPIQYNVAVQYPDGTIGVSPEDELYLTIPCDDYRN